MEEHPEIVSDLWVLCHLDFHEAMRGDDTRLLRACVRRLVHEPRSLFRANQLGGTEWFGWDKTAEILADVYDILGYQTSATAVNKKARPGKPYPRPKGNKADSAYTPRSVRDMKLGDFFGSVIS